jgi:malate dehydrogenase (oxaloacetate-decarboxylating)(NADP+)
LGKLRRGEQFRRPKRSSALPNYPSNILEAEIQTAARVAKLVFDSGLARVARPADMVAFIREHVYKPEYSNEAIRAGAAA